jgi:hypothetical protein
MRPSVLRSAEFCAILSSSPWAAECHDRVNWSGYIVRITEENMPEIREGYVDALLFHAWHVESGTKKNGMTLTLHVFATSGDRTYPVIDCWLSLF